MILVGIVDMFRCYCGALGDDYNRVSRLSGIKYPLGYKTGYIRRVYEVGFFVFIYYQ